MTEKKKEVKLVPLDKWGLAHKLGLKFLRNPKIKVKQGVNAEVFDTKKVHTKENTIVLFDVDGTLTISRGKITESMVRILKKLRGKVTIGFVGGSKMAYQKDQIGNDLLERFDYSFPQNGCHAFKKTELIDCKTFMSYLEKRLGKDKYLARYQEFVNHMMVWLSKKRECMLNVSPVGRDCSQEERMEFFRYDEEKEIRKAMCAEWGKDFADLGMSFVIGGQISIDIFPKGWDKTFCLNRLKKDDGSYIYENMYFFGDKTYEGGNDWELYTHPDVTGVHVDGPEWTEEFLKKMFLGE